MKASFLSRIIVSSLAGFWLAGCATVKNPSPATVPESVLSAPRVSPVSKTVLQPESPRTLVPAPAGPVERSSAEPPSYTSRLCRLMPGNCVVLESTETNLLVKRAAPVGSSSLFEEAIALSKLRGRLSAWPSLPKNIPQQTKIRNGTAVIPIGKSLPPEEAVDVIVMALSVDGIQEVRAVVIAR
ncbi:MAG: hypothetical protein ACOYM3_25485 [Terrimicrobiaceae bacterium]